MPGNYTVTQIDPKSMSGKVRGMGSGGGVRTVRFKSSVPVKVGDTVTGSMNMDILEIAEVLPQTSRKSSAKYYK